MDIKVGAFDPSDEKCVVYVDMYEQLPKHNSSIKVGVWVDNVDSRSEMYLSAKKEALKKLELAVVALKSELSE